MAVAAEILKTDSKNRLIHIKQTEENYVNFQTGSKDEEYEVNFYIFNEKEINSLREKQKELYDLYEKSSEKNRIGFLNILSGIIKKM